MFVRTLSSLDNSPHYDQKQHISKLFNLFQNYFLYYFTCTSYPWPGPLSWFWARWGGHSHSRVHWSIWWKIFQDFIVISTLHLQAEATPRSGWSFEKSLPSSFSYSSSLLLSKWWRKGLYWAAIVLMTSRIQSIILGKCHSATHGTLIMIIFHTNNKISMLNIFIMNYQQQQHSQKVIVNLMLWLGLQ